jgi:methylated-DNA-[protein]-cysteine S-methyltransferase
MAAASELLVQTTWGPIRLRAADGRLMQCDLPKMKNMPANPPRVTGHTVTSVSAVDRRVLQDGLRFVREALRGRQGRRPPLESGTKAPFLQAAWRAMERIPEGATCTYAELAARAGRPRAVRAAGQACARNPLPLFVPCHRVLGSGGALGGFSSGLPWKVYLLERERTGRGTR